MPLRRAIQQQLYTTSRITLVGMLTTHAYMHTHTHAPHHHHLHHQNPLAHVHKEALSYDQHTSVETAKN